MLFLFPFIILASAASGAELEEKYNLFEQCGRSKSTEKFKEIASSNYSLPVPKDVLQGEMPFMCRQYGRSKFCMAVIIDKKWLITPRMCVPEQWTTYETSCGQYSLNMTELSLEILMFRALGDPSTQDLAMLYVVDGLPMSPTWVQPACIYTSTTSEVGTRFLAVGFGHNVSMGVEEIDVIPMQQRVIKVVDPSHCEYWKGNHSLEQFMEDKFCATFVKYEGVPLDIGHAAFALVEGKWVVHGIAIRRNKRKGIMVYMRLNAHCDWFKTQNVDEICQNL